MSRRKYNKRNIVRQWGKRIFICILILLLCCSSLLSANAASDLTEKGFVEYKTEASIDFSEIIEVILTEKESGYYYTHCLYRDNDYTANISVPLGTYSVNAKVISDSGKDTSEYSVVYPLEDVVVQNTRSAVPISLRIDFLTGVEVSDEDYTEDVDASNEVIQTPSENVIYEEVTEEVSADDNFDEKDKDEHSLLYSTLSFLAVFALVSVVYLILKWKSNREK